MVGEPRPPTPHIHMRWYICLLPHGFYSFSLAWALRVLILLLNKDSDAVVKLWMFFVGFVDTGSEIKGRQHLVEEEKGLGQGKDSKRRKANTYIIDANMFGKAFSVSVLVKM